MQSDLVALVHNLADLLGKRFSRVSWCKPSRFDVVFIPELKEAVDTYCCAEDATRYVGRICWCAGFGVQPCFAVNEKNCNMRKENYHPAQASMSIPYEHKTRFGIFSPLQFYQVFSSALIGDEQNSSVTQAIFYHSTKPHHSSPAIKMYNDVTSQAISTAQNTHSGTMPAAPAACAR
jgi:hypothetical protein